MPIIRYCHSTIPPPLLNAAIVTPVSRVFAGKQRAISCTMTAYLGRAGGRRIHGDE